MASQYLADGPKPLVGALNVLRRRERDKRIIAGKRPKDCVAALNQREAELPNPYGYIRQLHPTKGWRYQKVRP